MSQTEDISASARTEMHCAPSADWPPTPRDGVVDVHDFVFGDGKSLSCDDAQLAVNAWREISAMSGAADGAVHES